MRFYLCVSSLSFVDGYGGIGGVLMVLCGARFA